MESDQESLKNVKTSYFRILAFFLSAETVRSAHVRCLLRWGLQLRLNQEDVTTAFMTGALDKTPEIDSKIDKLEAIYHLVFLINQDTVVEDAELEVASMYAQHLGFSGSVVSDLFSSVATASDDGMDVRDWKKEVADFITVHNL